MENALAHNELTTSFINKKDTKTLDNKPWEL